MALLVCLAAVVPARLLAQERQLNPLPVRSTTKWGEGLIAEGCERSSSFRRLVAGLRKTMLVVYVEPVRELPGVMHGATSLLALAGPYRYIRVSVGTAVTRKRQIALIAHELQHATEIAAAPEIVDAASLASFYRRIGDESMDGYDTSAAREMGDRVWTELWNGKPLAAPAADEVSNVSAVVPADLGRRAPWQSRQPSCR